MNGSEALEVKTSSNVILRLEQAQRGPRCEALNVCLNVMQVGKCQEVPATFSTWAKSKKIMINHRGRSRKSKLLFQHKPIVFHRYLEAFSCLLVVTTAVHPASTCTLDVAYGFGWYVNGCQLQLEGVLLQFKPLLLQHETLHPAPRPAETLDWSYQVCAVGTVRRFISWGSAGISALC